MQLMMDMLDFRYISVSHYTPKCSHIRGPELHHEFEQISYDTNISLSLKLCQGLGGDATLLFYGTEEGNEGKNAYNERRRPDFSKFPRLP